MNFIKKIFWLTLIEEFLIKVTRKNFFLAINGYFLVKVMSKNSRKRSKNVSSPKVTLSHILSKKTDVYIQN